jgi:AraC family transcriptional regulator of adaptative response / DNA-3-methyladenine glycosylase II
MDLDAERCYAAVRTRDARLDGEFFTCVRTTGIFCRPSCPSRTPARANVEFVRSAAAAVDRGFRACKRCGPLAPPGSADADPAGDLARRARERIEAGALDPGPDGPVPVAALAADLHVSERTLHRALVDHTGVGAVSLARMARARRAHELLTTTDLKLGEVAVAAGFGSERQMFDTVRKVYGLAPSALRPTAGRGRGTGPSTVVGPVRVRARLAVRRPFDGTGLADFLAQRAVPGVEEVTGTDWIRAVTLPRGTAVLRCDLGRTDGPLELDCLLEDVRDYPAALSVARRLFDLDADPQGIDAVLAESLPALRPLIAARPGVRLPGTASVDEALLWAITGQQVTVASTREQILRATDLLAAPLPPCLLSAGADHGLTRLPVDPARAAAHTDRWYRGPAARRRTLYGALAAGASWSADTGSLDDLRESLLALSGIGAWTADYTLLRGTGAIDVAPARDAALLAAARDLGIAEDHAELGSALEGARPFRSYAALYLWHHAAHLQTRDRRSTP